MFAEAHEEEHLYVEDMLVQAFTQVVVLALVRAQVAPEALQSIVPDQLPFTQVFLLAYPV